MDLQSHFGLNRIIACRQAHHYSASNETCLRYSVALLSQTELRNRDDMGVQDRLTVLVELVPRTSLIPLRPVSRSLSSILRLTFNRLRLWRTRARQRRALARLDDRLLDDIGLTREDARRETSKWFWQP